MLAKNGYPKTYLEACRARIEHALDELQAAAVPDGLGQACLEGLVLQLELMFVHRTRAIEGKDGNALNELRMLATSLLEHGGTFTLDRTVKYDPARSVLGLGAGERVVLSPAAVQELVSAVLSEIGAKFSA